MKPLLTAILAFVLGGCAANTPQPDEVGAQVQRGLSGQGQIVPLDRSEGPSMNPPVTNDAPANP